MELAKKRKTVAYCRVSTALQGSGLEAQVRQVRVYCDQMGIKDVEIFTDENQSGAKQNRPALDRMMTAVKNYVVPTFGTFTCARKSRRIRLNKTVRWAPSISARLCAS